MSDTYYQKYLKYKKKYLNLKSQVGSGPLVSVLGAALSAGDLANQMYNPSLPPEHIKALDGWKQYKDALEIDRLAMFGKPLGKYNKYDGKKDESKEVSMNVSDPYGMDYDWGYNNIYNNDGDDGVKGKQLSIPPGDKDKQVSTHIYKQLYNPKVNSDGVVTIPEDPEEDPEEEEEEDEEEEGDENEEDEITFDINGKSYSIAPRNFDHLLRVGIVIDNEIEE